MWNTVLLFRSSFPDISLIPMGSLAWAIRSRIAKHLSIAGTLFAAGDMVKSEFVSHMKHMFFISNGKLACQGKK
jgi:hypothetical protein